MPSIRRRLLVLLLWPALALLLAGALIDYFTAVAPVSRAYDQALVDAALAVGAHVHAHRSGRISVDMPAQAVAMLRADAVDSIYFRISAPDGSFVAGDPDLPESATAIRNPALANATYHGKPIRLATYRSAMEGGAVKVTVAETLRKRKQVRTQLLSAVVAVDLVELAAILALVWIAIRFGLLPLNSLREQIARRSARDLVPLPLQSVPAEVRGLVEALNGLFATVRESSRVQRQFLENAAHQLRTPLTGIQAQLELLAEESAPQARHRLRALHQATRRLAHTAQQLLALARSEHSSNLPLEFAPVDLTGLVEASVAKYLDQAIEHGIDLGADTQPALVPGVPWLLHELLNNLLQNALTHTPASGAITVRCGGDERNAYLEVVDSGIGIPAEERELVTQRFFRGRRANGEGSGLGLAIVSEIAQLHGAQLSIGAGKDGNGTCVRVDFLLAQELRQVGVRVR